MDYDAGNERVSSRSRVICLFPLPVGSPNTHTYHHENLSVVALFCCHYDNCAPNRPPRAGAGLGVKKRTESQSSISEASRFPSKWNRPAVAARGLEKDCRWFGLRRDGTHIVWREEPPLRQPPSGCLDGNGNSPLPNPMQNYIKKFNAASINPLVCLDLTKKRCF